MPLQPALQTFWALDAADVAARLGTGLDGLSGAAAAARLREVGPNALGDSDGVTWWAGLADQLRNPLLLILVFAAVVAGLTAEWGDAAIVLVIVVVTVGIGSSRERNARAAIAALRRQVRTRVRVRRDGVTTTCPIDEIVPGDVVELAAGSLVPGDGVLLEAADLYVSEAALTGESFPAAKRPGRVDPEAPVRARTNCVFLGANVRSGLGRCLIVRTGRATEYGAIAARLRLRPPETEFDRGIRQFGGLLTIAMLVLVLLVFAAHMLQGRPPVETLLFSVALAVGLSPELLPAILSVNLARGAQAMAKRGVVVRRLNAIENLGSMDMLCTDKTGTLTEGAVALVGAFDADGQPDETVLTLGALNAALETGVESPLDEAVLHRLRPDLSGLRKIAEVPFDASRRRASVVIESADDVRIVTKGAIDAVLEVCTRLGGGRPLDTAARAALHARHDQWAGEGVRVLAIGVRTLPGTVSDPRAEERDLRFAGFLTFLDPPKDGVAGAIADLARLGVSVKVITGDNGRVARHVAAQVGLRADRVLDGANLRTMPDEALWHAAERVDLFVEVDPSQKERIVGALRKTGHVVGFLGDGVNDAPAMHAADVSLAVAHATDVAREAADFVLLERDLDVIRGGIEEGRHTFANTLKYVLTTTSANLGNMVSMAAASLFLPFLPLLASQILLNNFLSDIPAIGLAGDRVDPELVAKPERWDLGMVGRFMVSFGLLSSCFDLATFAVLIGPFAATPALFRTGWFVESLLSELAIALVVRTRGSCFRSQPGQLLLVSTVVLIGVTGLLPYLPGVERLGFVPLPAGVLLAVCGIAAAYIVAAEATKHWFFATAGRRPRAASRPPPTAPSPLPS